MDRVFFEQLGLPDARYNLDCGSGSGGHGGQAGRMMACIDNNGYLRWNYRGLRYENK